MTRDSLAALLFLSPCELESIERGKRPIEPALLEKAALDLDCSLESLLESGSAQGWQAEAQGAVHRGVASPRIGGALRERRVALGLTRTEVADRAQRSDNFIEKVEAGHAPLDIATLFALAMALETTPEHLYQDDGDHPEAGRLVRHSEMLMSLLGSLKATGR